MYSSVLKYIYLLDFFLEGFRHFFGPSGATAFIHIGVEVGQYREGMIHFNLTFPTNATEQEVLDVLIRNFRHMLPINSTPSENMNLKVLAITNIEDIEKVYVEHCALLEERGTWTDYFLETNVPEVEF